MSYQLRQLLVLTCLVAVLGGSHAAAQQPHDRYGTATGAAVAGRRGVAVVPSGVVLPHDHAYPTYERPNRVYDVWFRPSVFGRGPGERIRPEPFTPRGYGNLFAKPSTPHRIDYNRYVLEHPVTQYGPSYYKRQ